MKNVFLFIFFLISTFSFAQSNAVTNFKENHATKLSLYFYPSTLRMINLEQNQEFDEMIREIKKARFFKMDSGAVNSEDLQRFHHELEKEGFEEVMFMKNKDTDVQVWGIQKHYPSLIIISIADGQVMLLEVNGMINIAKIPKLAETFNGDAFLEVFQLKQNMN